MSRTLINNTITIIVPKRSNRLDFVCRFIFHEILGLNYRIEEAQIDEYKLSFQKHQYNQFYSGFIAQGSEINKDGLSIEQDGSIPFFRSSEGKKYTFQEDLFAYVFFFLSRYEEYHFNHKDQYGRINSANLLSVKSRCHEIPLVDHKIREFGLELERLFGIQTQQHKPQYRSSFDVDHAWKYQHKGLLRNAGGMAKDLLLLNISGVIERLKVLLGAKVDPYHSFEEIDQFHKKTVNPIFFFLMGKYGGIDINIAPRNIHFLTFLRKFAKDHDIGIHPSYRSNQKPNNLIEEKNLLEDAVGRKIISSRQHFLILNFPDSYRALLESNISHDYSMGFHDKVGFRAGTAHSFLWYDLQQEIETSLRIHPFVAMDVSMRDYLQLTPQEAQDKLEIIWKSMALTGGEMMTIWHNNSFIDGENWFKWKSVLVWLSELRHNNSNT